METELLGVVQFAHRVSASPWTIRYHVAKGHLKSTRIGKRVLIPGSEITRIASEGLPHIPVAQGRTKEGHKSSAPRDHHRTKQEQKGNKNEGQSAGVQPQQ
jgi:hypothetical protein